MDGKKNNLAGLKVKSFITSLDSEKMEQTKGGLAYFVGGKKTNYVVRWTSVDTRVEAKNNKSSQV
jgi:hypothetical protein